MSQAQALRRLGWLWGPVFVYMAAIFLLSSGSDVPEASDRIWDKNIHAALYGGLTATAVRALAGGLWSGVTGVGAAAAVLIAVVYGVTDEVHQLFVPERYFDAADLAANAIGAVTAAVGIWGWSIIRARKQPSGSGREPPRRPDI